MALFFLFSQFASNVAKQANVIKSYKCIFFFNHNFFLLQRPKQLSLDQRIYTLRWEVKCNWRVLWVKDHMSLEQFTGIEVSIQIANFSESITHTQALKKNSNVHEILIKLVWFFSPLCLGIGVVSIRFDYVGCASGFWVEWRRLFAPDNRWH